jgi:hypothetical protein
MTTTVPTPTADEFELFTEIAACPERDAILDLIAACNRGPVARALTPDAELALVRDRRLRAAHFREVAEADEQASTDLPPAGPGRIAALRPVFRRMRQRLRQFLDLLTPVLGTSIARRLVAEFRDPATMSSLGQLGELIALAKTVLAIHARPAA